MKMNVADFIQTALLAGVILQLFLAYRAFRADHERRKKQATFEFVNVVSERYRNAIESFDAKHGKGKLVDIEQYDEEDRFFVRSYLSEIERICAGVNSGVFDYDILRKMISTHLRNSHHRFSQYIKERQSLNASVYTEFDEVVRRLNEDSSSEYVNIGRINRS